MEMAPIFFIPVVKIAYSMLGGRKFMGVLPVAFLNRHAGCVDCVALMQPGPPPTSLPCIRIPLLGGRSFLPPRGGVVRYRLRFRGAVFFVGFCIWTSVSMVPFGLFTLKSYMVLFAI